MCFVRFIEFLAFPFIFINVFLVMLHGCWICYPTLAQKHRHERFTATDYPSSTSKQPMFTIEIYTNHGLTAEKPKGPSGWISISVPGRDVATLVQRCALPLPVSFRATAAWHLASGSWRLNRGDWWFFGIQNLQHGKMQISNVQSNRESISSILHMF